MKTQSHWSGLLLALTVLIGTGPAAVRAPHRGERCSGSAADRAAAMLNAESLATLVINPFGRPETGWAVYAPTVGREIRTTCAPSMPGFARALSRWQAHRSLQATGVFDTATLMLMKSVWQARRPFAVLHTEGVCPDPPLDPALRAASPDETLGGKPVRLRRRALRAYRRMVAAERRAVGADPHDPDALKLFSGYRDPADDQARCAAENNCQGLVRAVCSAHRTGLALDLMVGAAPGFMADSTDDSNRLFQTRTAAYRWLVRNAGRFGFVNYVFEPWHWEWTGEAP